MCEEPAPAPALAERPPSTEHQNHSTSPEAPSLPRPPATMTRPLREPATKSARRFLRKKERSIFNHPPTGMDDSRVQRELDATPAPPVHAEPQTAVPLSRVPTPSALRAQDVHEVLLFAQHPAWLPPSPTFAAVLERQSPQQITRSSSVLAGSKLEKI